MSVRVKCSNCNEEFMKTHFNQKLCSDKCRAASKRKVIAKYKKSEKGIISEMKWRKSDARKATEKKYRGKSETKHLAYLRSRKCLANSPSLQESKREQDSAFGKTDDGRRINKTARKKYMQTEKGKISQINGKARRRQLEKTGKVTAKEWADKLKEFDYCCVNCGIDESIEMDHIIPLSKGGKHDISNIQPLCRSCNASKGAKLEWAN